jgi:hypothetical protein
MKDVFFSNLLQIIFDITVLNASNLEKFKAKIKKHLQKFYAIFCALARGVKTALQRGSPVAHIV